MVAYRRYDKLLDDTITKDNPGARDYTKDDNRYTIRAFAVSGDATEWSSDAMTMLSVDNVDDVGPLGPTNITAIANADGIVEADPDGSYTLLGLVDTYDPSVVPQSVTLTIEPEADPKTYESVMLVSNPVINANVIGNPVEISEGVFEITVNVGELGIAGNRAYTLHALAYDGSPDGPDAMYGNRQTDPSPESTIHVKNYLRPDPTVVQLTVDDGTGTNVDSGGPQGTFMFAGYTLEQSSPPIMSIRLEAKRESDPESAWEIIGTGDVSSSVDIEDDSLPKVLYHLAEAVDEDSSVVAIDATYREWLVSVDTIALGLEDTITHESPAARDASMDDNQYMVRTYAVDTNGNESLSDATRMFSLDNIDDVGPLGPTSVVVTSVSGTNAYVRRGDGNSFTVGGLVDKYDNAVPSPVATFTITPAAAPNTYATVTFTTATTGLLIGNVAETESGVFTVTVDVGTLANGTTHTFQALAVDASGNLEDDTDDSKAFVTVANTKRPPPEVLSISVDPASITQRSVDSGGPQGTIRLNARTPAITSPPISSLYFEVKRPSDIRWIPVGTSTSRGTWMLQVDTTTLPDTITKDNPGAYDHTRDNDQYMVRATAIATADGSRKLSPPHVTARFSVDNDDDVGPLGPTNIVEVATTAGPVEAEGDVYKVGRLVDKYDLTLEPLSLTFTIKPGDDVDPKTYAGGSARLFQTDPDGTETEILNTAGGWDVTLPDVGELANGTYSFHAESVDAFKNPQTDGLSPKITVIVENRYRPAPEVLALIVDSESITQTNPDSGAPQGTIMLNAYSHEISSPPTTSVKFEVKRKNDPESAWEPIGTATGSTETTEVSDATFADFIGDLANRAVSAAEASDGGNATVVPISRTYQMWAIDVDTTALEDTIMKDSLAARDASKDDNRYMVRAVPIEEASDFEDPGPSPDATAMFSVDNDDDVAPLGPTNVSVTNVEATGSVFEDAGDGSYTVGGLVDKYDEAVNDEAVNSPVATFTVEPTAHPDTYESIRFVPGVEGLVITDVKPAEDGAFTVTVNVGTLADGEYLENGIYMFHALAFDEFGNVQADDSETDGSRISVTVANTYRPAPQVLAFTVGDPTQTNPDSGAPQGTISLYGYSPEITSAPTTSVVFEVKRKNDTEWKAVGTASESSPVTAADDAKLAAADVADVAGENVVTSDTYQKWMIEVDTTTLEDSITADSPGARDHTKDDNQYMVRATAMAKVDGSANLSVDGVTEMFSVDNVDDVAPIGPTNVSVTSVDAIDSVLEAAEDGSSYTVGGLVDKYDEAVPSPVATFTLKPTADRKTYKSVRFVTDIENLVVTEVTETAEGSGVFTVTVDVGTLADMKTYLENGTYMFHALAFDEFANEQADDSETDGSKISVTVENSYRPAPEVLAIAVDPESITQTNPDSGAPQGTITLHSYSHEISSPPTTAVRFEVKRPSDAEWIDVGTATESSATEISDATLTDVVDDLAHVAVSATEAAEGAEGTVVPISRNQMWTIEVDTTTLEDTITAESPAARDASKDDNQYMVRAVAIAEADGSETLSADGVTAMFSVDNVDDVPPVGPTNIVAVADVAGMIAANEDGSYTVGGIVDDTVPTPIAIFTTEPTADPITYEGASVNLVQTIAEDGSRNHYRRRSRCS